MGPLGFLPASGTVTVGVVGLPLFWLTRDWPVPFYCAAAAAFILASVGLHQWGDRILGEKDSRKLVWDEVAGFLVAVIAVPFTWQTALAALLIERLFDVTKVQPARWVEDHWPGGWGVVGDDIVAGLYALMVLQGLIAVSPGLLGLPPG